MSTLLSTGGFLFKNSEIVKKYIENGRFPTKTFRMANKRRPILLLISKDIINYNTHSKNASRVVI
jgi:hypothetical protein